MALKQAFALLDATGEKINRDDVEAPFHESCRTTKFVSVAIDTDVQHERISQPSSHASTKAYLMSDVQRASMVSRMKVSTVSLMAARRAMSGSFDCNMVLIWFSSGNT